LVGELVGLSGRDIRKIVFEAVVSRDSDNIGDPVVEHDITAVLDARRAL
jgi:hypothetical protein